MILASSSRSTSPDAKSALDARAASRSRAVPRESRQGALHRGGTGAGRDLVQRGFGVFLDLKFHDIPNTVAAACRAAAALGVWMLNVHASGGRAMLEAAREAMPHATPGAPKLIAVTLLTSMSASRSRRDRHERHADGGRAAARAARAKRAGSTASCARRRKRRRCEARAAATSALVTPGIRPAGAGADDQQRVMTPADAIAPARAISSSAGRSRAQPIRWRRLQRINATSPVQCAHHEIGARERAGSGTLIRAQASGGRLDAVTQSRIGRARVLVVGDVMLDRYWFGEVGRISPEAPVPVVKIDRIEERPGGAANVARNAAALGAQVSLLSVVGRDEAGATAAHAAAQRAHHAQLHTRRGAADHDQAARDRPPAAARAHRFRDRAEPRSARVQAARFPAAAAQHATSVILSDYGKGGLTHIVQHDPHGARGRASRCWSIRKATTIRAIAAQR